MQSVRNKATAMEEKSKQVYDIKQNFALMKNQYFQMISIDKINSEMKKEAGNSPLFS